MSLILGRPGTIRVRLRLNPELWARLKKAAERAGKGYTTLAREYVAAGVELEDAVRELHERESVNNLAERKAAHV